jgi:hypothetical protein
MGISVPNSEFSTDYSLSLSQDSFIETTRKVCVTKTTVGATIKATTYENNRIQIQSQRYWANEEAGSAGGAIVEGDYDENNFKWAFQKVGDYDEFDFTFTEFDDARFLDEVTERM